MRSHPAFYFLWLRSLLGKRNSSRVTAGPLSEGYAVVRRGSILQNADHGDAVAGLDEAGKMAGDEDAVLDALE